MFNLPYEIRNPTPEEKEAELRLYFVIRRDIPISAGSLARLAAEASCRTLESAASAAPQRFTGYHVAAQPKIALRARDAKDLAKAAALSMPFPHLMLKTPDGTPLLLALGPVARNELPKFILQLQMLSSDAPDNPRIIPAKDGSPALWLVVREDAGTPYGKLAAQAGHGAWKAVRSADAAMLEAWRAAGYPVRVKRIPDEPGLLAVHKAATAAGLPASFIVDAGRTHFAEPTSTVVGIGPATDVADLIAALPDLV